MTQATTPQTLIQGTLSGNTNHKNFRSAKHWITKSWKRASIITTSLIPPTITHSNWSTYFRSKLWRNISILHTPPNSSLTQPTPLLNSDPPFDKSNFICSIVASPNLKPTYTLLWSRISWLRYHAPLALQTSGIPNHVFWATNSRYTKPRARILMPGAQHVPNHVSTLDQLPITPFHKKTPWYLMWLNYTTI